jgi:hypothetical protein
MSIVDAGCGFAIFTHCVDSTNDDDLVVPTSIPSDKDEWNNILTTSPLFCDLDFASEMSFDMDATGDFLGHNVATAAFFSYSNRQLSPCGLNSVFVVKNLSIGQALIDVSNCRMQVDETILLPASVLLTNLQWKSDIGHVHVEIDVATAKEQYFKVMQQAQLKTIQVVGSSSMQEEKDLEQGLCGAPESRIISAEPKLVAPLEPMPIPALSTPPHLVQEADTLHKLKLMVQDEVDDMHHVLVVMGVVAIFLILVFVWTLWQIVKPKTKPRTMSGSIPHSIACTRSATPANMSPVSMIGNTVDDEDSSSSLSPCAKVLLQQAERRRMQEQNASRNHVQPSRVFTPFTRLHGQPGRVITPLSAKNSTSNNMFTTTPVAIMTTTPRRIHGKQQMAVITPILVNESKTVNQNDKKSIHTVRHAPDISTAPSLVESRDDDYWMKDDAKAKDDKNSVRVDSDNDDSTTARAFTQDFYSY